MQHTDTLHVFFRQSGLSLVELMISLAIGLVLLLGISTLIVQQNTTRNEMEKSSRQIESGRYAIQLLHDDIALAGFFGEYSPAPPFAMTLPDPCLTTGNLGWDSAKLTRSVPVPIIGYAGAGADPTPSACLDNYKPNTAVLVLRRASTASIPVASAVAATTFLQVTRCSSEADATPFVLGTGGFKLHLDNCVSAPPGTLASLRPYIVRIYYISSCSVCGTDTIPTLKMVEFVGGARTLVPLVEGIENMQFEYGIDTLGGRAVDAATNVCVPAAGGDGSADTYTATPAAGNWQNVMTVRVNLLARNNDITPGYTDDKSYSLGEAASSVSPGGSYKRHVYSQLIRATNPSGRRERC